MPSLGWGRDPWLDAFLMRGQSNDKGVSSTPAQAPAVAPGDGLEYVHATRSFVQMAEPMQANNDTGLGGPWSAFAVEWARITGRQPVIRQDAVSGSAQQTAAQVAAGHWHPGGAGGDNYTAKKVETQNYMADLAVRPTPSVLRGVVWGQGGRDAIALDDGVAGVTKQGYKDSFAAMVAATRTDLGLPNLPFFIVKLGRPLAADTAGFATIRAAQEELATEVANVFIVWRGAVDYPARGLQADAYHYNQAGYNEEGTLAARGVAALV